MIRSFVSLLMVVALLLTNASGYHCHGPRCGDDNALMALWGEGYSQHDKQHAKLDKADHSESDGGSSTQSETHHVHSHGANLVVLPVTAFIPAVFTVSFEWQNDRFISGTRKPLLQPPSLS